MTTSVIILTRNRPVLLERCLKSLNDFKKSRYEIIVVDNSSGDDTEIVLKKYKKKIGVIKNGTNLGVASARNLGFKKASGEFLIFLDDDAFIKNDSFTPLVKHMDSNKDVGIMGPKILYPSGRLQESARRFPDLLALIWRGTFLSKVFPNFYAYKQYIMNDLKSDKPQQVDWVIGACLVIRKEVFKKIGLFDEKFFFGYEDVDFCTRAKNAGWKTVYYPKVKIYHDYARESSKGIISKAKIEHIKSIIYYFWKNYVI